MKDPVMLVFLILAILFWVWFFAKFFSSRFGRVKTVEAKVVGKFKSDSMTKIYSSAARAPAYTVVFETGGKRRSFRVGEFSYNGYRVGETGTLKYRGSRLISFH